MIKGKFYVKIKEYAFLEEAAFLRLFSVFCKLSAQQSEHRAVSSEAPLTAPQEKRRVTPAYVKGVH